MLIQSLVIVVSLWSSIADCSDGTDVCDHPRSDGQVLIQTKTKTRWETAITYAQTKQESEVPRCYDIATNVRDDGEPICSYYKRQGWCTSFDNAREGCQKTCGLCSTAGILPPRHGDCFDIATNIRDDGEPICSYYQRQGWCEKYDHARDGCKLTCGVCDPIMVDDFREPPKIIRADGGPMLAQTKQESEIPPCYDEATNVRDDGEPICTYYHRQGWCEENWLRDGCKLTCGVCDWIPPPEIFAQKKQESGIPFWGSSDARAEQEKENS